MPKKQLEEKAFQFIANINQGILESQSFPH